MRVALTRLKRVRLDARTMTAESRRDALAFFKVKSSSDTAPHGCELLHRDRLEQFTYQQGELIEYTLASPSVSYI